MTAVSQFAPAKVNLYLHVTGRRGDGYHSLDSLVVFADVGDHLRITAARSLSLAIEGPSGPELKADDDNSVLRAAHGLAALLSRPAHAAITLEKHLPVAAGIGGGSADAAAALRGLSALWGTAPAGALAELGLGLGADVPVCLAGRPTQMAGIGEQLRPAVALPPAWLVLVNPRRALSTPAVFKARSGPFSEPAPLTQAPRDVRQLADWLAEHRNDLAAAAATLEPAIAPMLAALAATSGCLLARMSGSGATCFGLYAESDAAAQAAASLAAQQPGWWVRPAALLA